MRSNGNTASNALWNPDERHHPPPTSSMAEERDSEMERYIRKKYELGLFKAGSSASSSSSRAPVAEPTSLNRARERDGRPTVGRTAGAGDPWAGRENRWNPELNDVVVRSPNVVAGNVDRDLPPIPLSAGAPPRRRPSPVKGVATAAPTSGQAQLINLDGGQSSTLPLQLNTGFPSQSQPQMAFQPQQRPFQSTQLQQSQSTFQPQPSTQFGLSPQPMNSWMSTSPMQSYQLQQPQPLQSTSFLPSQSPQPQYGQHMPMMSTGTPMGMGMGMQPTGMMGMQYSNGFSPANGFQPQMSGQYMSTQQQQQQQQQQYAGHPGQMAMGYTNTYGMR